MLSNINDDVLLLGEANFSFTLSLVNYCDPKFITSTSYESEEEVYKKYDQEIVKQNIEKLKTLKCKEILFGVDACNLEKSFPTQKFRFIIFMFPHVSGRSNLKKNRHLIDDFLRSARHVMKESQNFDFFQNKNILNRDNLSSCIYITLAKGQGGTSFEIDEKKRNNKDSWNINEIAQKNGYILTDCFLLNKEKFTYYQSTGFRNQKKSFHIDSALVHKFELSLPIIELDDDKPVYYNSVCNYLNKSKFFYQNELDRFKETNRIIHPLIELKYMLVNYINQDFNYGLNFINDNNFKEDTNINDIKTTIESSVSYVRPKLKENFINIISGLILKPYSSTFDFEKNPIFEFNNFSYEILFYFFEFSNEKLNIFKSKLIEFLFKSGVQSKNLQFNSPCILLNSKNVIEFKFLNDNEFSCVIDATALLLTFFALNDESILYTNDKRVFLRNETPIEENKFNWIIKPLSIEKIKFFHDISFWLNDKIPFEYNYFINIIRDTCNDLVKQVHLIDKYTTIDKTTGEIKLSYCFRLLYESCDKALNKNFINKIQLNLRKNLSLNMKIELK